MSTTATSNFAHAPPSDHFDPDEVLPKNSPLLAPFQPRLRSPTPPLIIASNKVSDLPSPGTRRSNHRRERKVQPSQGDALLVALLDGGRHPEIAIQAGNEVLPSASESDFEDSTSISSASPRRDTHLGAERDEDRHGAVRGPRDVGDGPAMASFELTSLAAGALAQINHDVRPDHIDAGPTPPVTEHDVVSGPPEGRCRPPPFPARRDAPLHDERAVQPGVPSPYSITSLYSQSPRDPGHPIIPRMDLQSPTRLPAAVHSDGGLAPIHSTSPRSESNGHTPLPSIRMQLGDITQLSHDHAELERARRQQTYAPSPQSTLTRLPSMHAHHASPPVSPVDTFRRELPSPGYSIASTSPGYPYPTNGLHRAPPEYASSSTETPGTDQSGSTPGTIPDQMSINGITHQPTGYYMCQFPGCNASPFQTQYLLNSHANVHSSARPHYCPVKGCPRGDGGRGFKRKNEMIRHGLVHDSPGYVCPFCPDREHKYPRPDNLQRYTAFFLSSRNSATLSFFSSPAAPLLVLHPS